MYLYGAGGHAKVIIDILEQSGITLEGIYDDNPPIDGQLLNYPVLNSREEIKEPVIVSIGDNKTRKKIVESLDVEFNIAVHSSAIISKRAVISNGTVIMHGAIIQSCSKIGSHSIINTGASIDHDCYIGDFVHISPGAALCGSVSIGEGTLVGAGAVVIPGINIGKWCVIGAGAVITKDIPDYSLAYGNKNRVIRKLTR